MTTISVRLQKPILRDLSEVENQLQTDRSEVIRRLLIRAIQEWKIENALNDIKNHKISVGKAAEECGLSLWEMLDLVKDIDWTGYSKADLKKDISLLK